LGPLIERVFVNQPVSFFGVIAGASMKRNCVALVGTIACFIKWLNQHH
jgi:hypothetical protein